MASASASSKTAAAKPEPVREVMDFGVEGWRPEPGDTFTGRVENITIGASEWGQYPIVEIKSADNTHIAVHAFHHTLQKNFAMIKPKVGHEVTVTYHGHVGGESGQNARDGKGVGKKGYHAYTVTSPQYVFNWDAFGQFPDSAPDVPDEDAATS